MNKSKFVVNVIFIGLLVFQPSCGFSNKKKQNENPNSTVTIAPVSSPTPTVSTNYLVDHWEEAVLSHEDAKLQVKTLKAKYREEIKQKFRVPELIEVKSEYAGNYTLYRISNFDEASNIVFIQPKLFVFGTAQGGNVLKLSSSDGQRVSLTIPMSYVDGLKSSLTSYEGHDSVSLPQSLVIPNINALKEDLSKQLGANIQLQALPSCPKELSLVHIKGRKTERYRLIPTIPIQSRCSTNEFFTASISSSREEITDLIENAVETGLSVQILSQFRVEYRNPIAVYSLHLNPIGIYKKLREKFVATPFGSGVDPTLYFPHQLVGPLQQVLIDEIGQTGANPAWVPYSQGVNELEDTYFDEVTGQSGCPAPQRCFRVKKQGDINFNGPIELMWIEEDTLGASDLISTVTLVKGLDESFPVAISNQRVLPMTSAIPTAEACTREKGNIPGCPGFSCEKFSDNAYCRKGTNKAVIGQFQVFPGAKLKISINRITDWRFELPVPRDETPDNKKKGILKCAHSQEVLGACAEYKTKCPRDLIDFCPQPKNECDDKQKVYEDHCSEECQFESHCGFLGLGHCTQELKDKKKTCQKVEIGEFCKHYKTECAVPVQKVCPVEQVTECVKPAIECTQYTTEFYSKYVYSDPWVTPKYLDFSKGESPEQLWEGIDIEFSSLKEDGSGYDKVVCPLLAFPHLIDGHHSISLTLNNQANASCQPFNDWNQKEGRWPTISIINHIAFTRYYSCGSLEWTHTVDSNSTSHTRDLLSYSCPATRQTSERPIQAQYQPIIDLAGTVSLLGRSIDTVSSGNK